MKHQQVNVDYWAMFQSMFTYGVLSILCWVMLRLFHAVFTLPRRLRSQQENIHNTLQELQCVNDYVDLASCDPYVINHTFSDITFGENKRFPDLNITEEDLENAEKELEELTKEADEDKYKSCELEEDKCKDKLEKENKSAEKLEEKNKSTEKLEEKADSIPVENKKDI